MNEDFYKLWAKAEWAKNKVQSAWRELESVLDEFDDLTDHLEVQMVEDSDSENFSEALAKYVAMEKLKKADGAEV